MKTMKHRCLSLFLLLGVLCSTCVRADATRAQPSEIRTKEDLKGCLCGAVIGTAMDILARKIQPDLRFAWFNSYIDAVEALMNGKIDAVAIDAPLARCWAARSADKIKIAFFDGKNPFGYFFAKGNPLKDRFNRELRQMIENGEVQRIVSKWCNAPDLATVAQENVPSLPASCGVLKFTSSCEEEPGAFIRNGSPVGFDIDIVRIIASRLGLRVEVVTVSQMARISVVQAGKADCGGGCVTITDERKQTVDFSDCYLDDGYAVLIRRKPTAADAAVVKPGDGARGFVAALRDSFVRTFVTEGRWKMMLSGLGVTLFITLLASLFGTLLAFPVWLARTSSLRLVAALAKAYIATLQGTPILVLLMVLFYLVFGSVDINGIWVAVIGFSLNASAYLGEALRSGIDSVARGQTEAALALGYGSGRAFFRFVLPQAARAILPVYRGELIAILKATSIVGYIAIHDLTKASDLIRGRTYESFFPILTTAFVYFAVAWLMALSIDGLGRRLDPACRKNWRRNKAKN